MQFPILSVILFLPLAGALGAVALPRMAGWGWALLVALADLAACVWLIFQFSAGTGGMQFVESHPWLPEIGINYALGVDGVNLFLLALNALLTAVALGASFLWYAPVTARANISAAAAAEHRYDGRLSRDQPVPLLCLLGADARSRLSAAGDVRRNRGGLTRP